MELIHVLSFALVAALLVMSPGPNGVLIAKTVPTSGRAAGFANVGGFVAAFYLHGALSIFGISVNLVQAAFLLVCIHALLNAVWFAAMILLLARLLRAARSGRFQRWLKGVTGVVFVMFGAKLAALSP